MRLALLLLLLPSLASANAWTRQAGSHYVSLSANTYRAGSVVDPATGDAVPATYVGRSYGLYGEVGVLPVWPLMVSASVPLSVGTSHFEDPSFGGKQGSATVVRAGDLRVALQGAILHEGPQLAVQFEAKVPLYANGRVGVGFGNLRPWFPRPGDGQVDLTPRVKAGGGIPNTPMFAQGSLGFRFRTPWFVGWTTDTRFAHGVVFDAQIGARFGPLVVIGTADAIVNVQRDDVTRESLTLAVQGLLDLWKGLALEARFAGEPWARNAAQGVTFGLGISWRMPT
jgi:hypothetical protein